MFQESHHCELEFVFNHEIDPDYQNIYLTGISLSMVGWVR